MAAMVRGINIKVREAYRRDVPGVCAHGGAGRMRGVGKLHGQRERAARAAARNDGSGTGPKAPA